MCPSHPGSTSVSFVTPVLPGRAEHLPDTGSSVEAARLILAACGHDSEWIVAVDGPGKLDSVAGATIVTSPLQVGAACARNLALASAGGEWLVPVDADDLVEGDGVLACLRAAGLGSLKWVGASRTRIDGTATPHTVALPRRFVSGALALHWSSPFPFHPNSVVVRRDILLACGGWPELATNEDLGMILTVSEEGPGARLNDILTRYRVWEGQIVAGPGYETAKATAFQVISASLNKRRQTHGRPAVATPLPGGAHGRQTVW